MFGNYSGGNLVKEDFWFLLKCWELRFYVYLWPVIQQMNYWNSQVAELVTKGSKEPANTGSNPVLTANFLWNARNSRSEVN